MRMRGTTRRLAGSSRGIMKGKYKGIKWKHDVVILFVSTMEMLTLGIAETWTALLGLQELGTFS